MAPGPVVLDMDPPEPMHKKEPVVLDMEEHPEEEPRLPKVPASLGQLPPLRGKRKLAVADSDATPSPLPSPRSRATSSAAAARPFSSAMDPFQAAAAAGAAAAKAQRAQSATQPFSRPVDPQLSAAAAAGAAAAKAAAQRAAAKAALAALLPPPAAEETAFRPPAGGALRPPTAAIMPSEALLRASAAAAEAAMERGSALRGAPISSCSESEHSRHRSATEASATETGSDSDSEAEGAHYDAAMLAEGRPRKRPRLPKASKMPCSGAILRSVRGAAATVNNGRFPLLPPLPLGHAGGCGGRSFASGRAAAGLGSPGAVTAATAASNGSSSSIANGTSSGSSAAGSTLAVASNGVPMGISTGPFGQPFQLPPPFARAKVEVSAARMHEIDESIRSGAEKLLHEFWDRDDASKICISRLLDMQLKGISLRSGRKTGRVDNSGGGSSTAEKFLVWQAIHEDANGRRVGLGSQTTATLRVVGALILQWKRRSGRKQGGAVIDYIAVSRSRRGQGWPLVCAAEGICRDLGLDIIYSAADMSHDGRYADLTASPALTPVGGVKQERSAMAAHGRWGFRESSKEEWKSLGLPQYDDRRCTVHYMKKPLQ